MKKILFIDRDGTLIKEPQDEQIDQLEKFHLMENVITSLVDLKNAGYHFVMISNQDGLGTSSFSRESFEKYQNLLIDILETHGIIFEAVRICPHFEKDGCDCRKPKISLLLDYLQERKFDPEYSFVIGDRVTDLELAKNLGVSGIHFGSTTFPNWQAITQALIHRPRTATVSRKTTETDIFIQINLDQTESLAIQSGIGFFDHMLEQLAKHSGISLTLKAQGDTHIDDHHLVEDCGITLGQAFKKALGDKHGIGRYGFVLPMDEAEAFVTLDLSGRNYFLFEGIFNREKVGELSTELVSHFFRSFCESLSATLHMKVIGENEHHKIEALFKCLGRALRDAIRKTDNQIPSTKGCL